MSVGYLKLSRTELVSVVMGTVPYITLPSGRILAVTGLERQDATGRTFLVRGTVNGQAVTAHVAF